MGPAHANMPSRPAGELGMNLYQQTNERAIDQRHQSQGPVLAAIVGFADFLVKVHTGIFICSKNFSARSISAAERERPKPTCSEEPTRTHHHVHEHADQQRPVSGLAGESGWAVHPAIFSIQAGPRNSFPTIDEANPTRTVAPARPSRRALDEHAPNERDAIRQGDERAEIVHQVEQADIPGAEQPKAGS